VIAVADTGPLLYLSLIDSIDLLPQLYEQVLIPQAVADELSHALTPELASVLLLDCPSWLQIVSVELAAASFSGLQKGEREAIALAVSVQADMFLVDDAEAKGYATRSAALRCSGTLGVLQQAVRNDLVRFTAMSFDASTERLWSTNFHRTSNLRTLVSEISRSLHLAGL